MAAQTLSCPVCGVEFTPRDPRQRCCSKPCGIKAYLKSERYREKRRVLLGAKHEQIRASIRERYRTDPVFRQKCVDAARKRRQENPDAVRAINARSRDTPERREKAAAVSRQWHADNRQYSNDRRITRKQNSRTAVPWLVLINAAKARAKKKGLVFSLTPAWGEVRWTGRCELSGLPFTLGLRGSGAKRFSPSIDKIDPKKGYTPSNCCIILWCLNAFKYDGTDDQMLMVARALVARHPFTRTRALTTLAQQPLLL
jgi:hypothetical protein